MPLWSEHDECGLLLFEAGGLILQRDDGGRWRLDAPRKAQRLLGRRVRVEGVRCDFDMLDVRRIEPC